MENLTTAPATDDITQPGAIHLLDLANDDIHLTLPITEIYPRQEERASQAPNLNKKITSLNTVNDPFKSLFRTQWRAHAARVESIPQGLSPSSGRPPSTTIPSRDEPEKVRDGEELTTINGQFQNLTLQRVLALRKVQASILSAPNVSAVGAGSTSFAEEDLKCLTMEELQALQRRKRAVVNEVQPMSVVKASIQAERSKKRLEPRDYQIELFERARRENTIAVLGTGTGKTLIACLLIKDILVQERVNRVNGKKALTLSQCINK